MTQFEAVLERMRDMARRENVACGLHPWPMLPPSPGSRADAAIADRRAKVVALAAAGVPYREIARQFGVNVGTVSWDLQAAREFGK